MIQYTIIGDEAQAVEIGLDPGQTVIAEAGAMSYMNDAIKFETRKGDNGPVSAGDGVVGALVRAGRNLLGEAALLLTHFTNTGESRRSVAFSAPWPGKIMVLDLTNYNGEIFCQKESFLCAADNTRIEIAFSRRFGAGLFGKEGFILERLSGVGPAFIHVGGALVEKTLKNETIKVDSGCIAAFTTGLDYSIEQADHLKSTMFGGRALFLASLSGTGTVFLQTLPFSRLADRVINGAAAHGKTAKAGVRYELFKKQAL